MPGRCFAFELMIEFAHPIPLAGCAWSAVYVVLPPQDSIRALPRPLPRPSPCRPFHRLHRASERSMFPSHSPPIGAASQSN